MLKTIFGFACLSVTLAVTTIAFGGKDANSDIPQHGKAVVLFDGRDLTNFNFISYAQKRRHSFPRHYSILDKHFVFRVKPNRL